MKVRLKAVIVMVLLGLWFVMVWGWLIVTLVFGLPLGCVRAVTDMVRGR